MNATDPDEFAATLRRLRRATGLTQQDLADCSGVSVRSVSDLERGISERPRRDTARMLAAGLGLSDAKREAFLDAARPRPRAMRPGYPAPPAPHAPLLGRATELRAIEEALIGRGAPILTLTGPGGVGKTRLATEAALLLADRFADGAVFVRLDGLADPALVLPTLAGALRLLEIGDGTGLKARIAAHLRGRELLVVLDNLEHLLPAAGDLADLAGQTSRTRFLTTSREALRVRGEHVVAVPTLPLPDPALWLTPAPDPDRGDSPALALFVARALAMRPALAVDPRTDAGRANLAVIAEICRRLDGLPLAIELAAAQAEVLAPASILALLKDAALPRFAAGGRDQPARFQTLPAAIGWSYDRLSPEEQAVFRTLSVFAGGFTLPAAVAVIAAEERFDPRQPRAAPGSDAVGAIAALARKHLVTEDAGVSGELEPRFRMLEPIRLFALERLRDAGEEPVVRQRHAAFCSDLFKALDALTLGPDPEIALRRQAAELDNARAALDWTLTAGEHALAVRLTCFVAQLWEIRGLVGEARQRIARAIAVDGTSVPAMRWFLRFWAGTFALDRGEPEEAAFWARELSAIAEAAPDPVGVGVGLAALSRAVGASPGRHAEAAELARRAAEILDPLGQEEWSGWAWSRLGIEQRLAGQPEEARSSLLRGLEARRRKSCAGCIPYSLLSLGAAAMDLDEPEAALAAFGEGLALTLEHENQALTLAFLLGLADLAWQFGAGAAPERGALRLAGAAEALRRRHGLGRWSGAEPALDRWEAPMRARLGGQAVDACLAEGMGASLAEAARLVDELAVGKRRWPDSVSLLAGYGSVE